MPSFYFLEGSTVSTSFAFLTTKVRKGEEITTHSNILA